MITKQILAFCATALLCGCGVLSGTIRSNVLDYSDVVGTTTDKFLLVNILEARDDAPLHFAALAGVHGSLQATASLATTFPFPVGSEGPSPAAGAFLNGTTVPTVSVQSSPTFDVNNIESKEFTNGLSSTIDPKFIKYWVDRGLDKRIILLMFFSAAQIVEGETVDCPTAPTPPAASKEKARRGAPVTSEPPRRCFRAERTIIVHNNPREAVEGLKACVDQDAPPTCHSRTEFELYLKLLNYMRRSLSAHGYKQRVLVAHDQALDIKDAGGIDPAKYEVERSKDGKFDLYSVPASPSYALCADGKMDVLSGRLTVDEDARPIPPLTHAEPVADGKDKKGKPDKKGKKEKTKIVTEASAPARGNACTDETVNVVPYAQPLVSSDKNIVVRPHVTDASPYFVGPCSEPGPADPEAYCQVFLRFWEFLDKQKGCADEDSVDATSKAALLACISNGTEKEWDQRFRLSFTPRSVAEMIRFVGDVEYYQENLPENAAPAHHNRYITIDFKRNCGDDVTCAADAGGWLFRLYKDAGDGQVSVAYGDATYSVARHRRGDHSLEILSILNQLVNFNKSATDLRLTPTVQIAP
jgi:hypothetical protein